MGARQRQSRTASRYFHKGVNPPTTPLSKLATFKITGFSLVMDMLPLRILLMVHTAPLSNIFPNIRAIEQTLAFHRSHLKPH